MPWRQRLGRFYLVSHTVTLEMPGGWGTAHAAWSVLGAVTLKASVVSWAIFSGVF